MAPSSLPKSRRRGAGAAAAASTAPRPATSTSRSSSAPTPRYTAACRWPCPSRFCEACADTGAEARIKWPNDIWAGERKLSGMLIDAESGSDGLVAYAGIGVNVNGDPAANPELRDIATSIRRELGRPVDREALLAGVCNALERALALPAEALAAAYRERSMILGRAIEVHDPEGMTAATAVTIDHGGALVVRTDAGELRTLTAAEVSVRPATSPRPR